MAPQQEMPTPKSVPFLLCGLVTTGPFLSGLTGECGEGGGKGQRQSQEPQDAGVTSLKPNKFFNVFFFSQMEAMHTRTKKRLLSSVSG